MALFKFRWPCLLLCSVCMGLPLASAEPTSFGGPSDVNIAVQLWQTLTAARLVGPVALQSKPYPGRNPHGVVLQRFDARISSNPVVVLRNYRGAELGVQAVAQQPQRFLQSISVMAQRPGYDPQHRNWFWAEYAPDGQLLSNAQGSRLAGRVDRDRTASPGGCIGCHRSAGEELRFRQ